jgi:hypothetical protein
MSLGNEVKALYSLTPREIINRVGIGSTKCLKNDQIDGIPLSVGSPWSERKIQPNLSKELAIIRKMAVVLRHSKKPWHRGKKKPGV